MSRIDIFLVCKHILLCTLGYDPFCHKIKLKYLNEKCYVKLKGKCI